MSLAEVSSSGQLVSPKPQTWEIRKGEMGPILNLISLKPNYASHLHTNKKCEFSTPNPLNILLKLSVGISYHHHYRLYCFDSRWRKTQQHLGGCVRRLKAGGGREYWLMLICLASILWGVSIGSQGPGISAAVLGLPPWFELYSHPVAADMMLQAAIDTRPLSCPQTLSSLIICQLLTLTRLWINQCWQTSVTISQRGHCL